MSEGRIENLAALMAAIVVVLKTGDLPQKMKPKAATRSDRAPHGLYAHVAATLGVGVAVVSRVGQGKQNNAAIAGAIEAAKKTYISRSLTDNEQAILRAVAAELGCAYQHVDHIRRGIAVSARGRDLLARHGWERSIPVFVPRNAFPLSDRHLVNFYQIAKSLNCAGPVVANVFHGKVQSARVRAAIEQAIADAKAKAAAQ